MANIPNYTDISPTIQIAKLWSSRGVMPFGRHWETWYLYVDRAEVVAAGEVQGLPVIAAEGDIGGGGSAVDDAAQLLAVRVHDPYSARSAAIDVAFHIHFHAVGNTRLIAAQIDKDAVGLLGERAVGQ